MTNAEKLKNLAKEKSPIYIHYKGKLSEDEVLEIEETCDIHSPTVYMDGSAIYSIKYRRVESEEVWKQVPDRL